jgi:tetratricopeptide (TPR) repeat protein
VALAIALYANTLGFDYALDDHIVVTDNRFTHEGLAGIPAIFAHDSMAGYYGTNTIPVAGGRYRPLSLATFALEYALLGERPAVSHLVNVLCYGATVLLLFLLLLRLFPADAGASWYASVPFLAAALFAAHPLHTEVVANIKGRDDLLSLLFGLAALLAWLRHVDTRQRAAAVATGALFFLALLGKESALGLLAVAPVLLWCFRRTTAGAALAALAPLAAGALAYVALRAAVLGIGSATVVPELMNDPFLQATAGQRLATILYTWLLYLKLLVLPHPLTHDYYPYHVTLVGFGDPAVLLALLVCAALAAVLLRELPRRTVVAFCLAWYVATFALYSNLLVDIGTFMNERFLYVPSIGFCLLLAWALRRWLPAPRTVAAVAVLLVVAGGAKTFARNFAWKDDVTLALTDVETSRGSARAQMAAGWAHLTLAMHATDEATTHAELAQAIEHLRTSIGICDTYYPAQSTLASALAQNGQYAEALRYYEACYRMKPGNPTVTAAIEEVAQHAAASRDAATAVGGYEFLIAAEPSAARYGALAEIYGKDLGDPAKAEATLQAGLSRHPDDPGLLGTLGIVYGMTGRSAEALALFDRALAREPRNASFYRNKARALRQLGRDEEADRVAARAAELDAATR